VTGISEGAALRTAFAPPPTGTTAGRVPRARACGVLPASCSGSACRRPSRDDGWRFWNTTQERLRFSKAESDGTGAILMRHSGSICFVRQHETCRTNCRPSPVVCATSRPAASASLA
jgi:hypothetical protein